MKQFYTILIMLISFSGTSQVETELTNYLNQLCNVTVCQDIQLGACPGDVNSDGTPYEFTSFSVKYITQTIEIHWNSITLRNTRLEFRNGANLVDNGIDIFIENDCDTSENITEIVFIGGGQRFSSVEEMNATLNIIDHSISLNNVFDHIGETYSLYNCIGQVIYSGPITASTKTDLKNFSGLYYLRLDGYRPIKILN